MPVIYIGSACAGLLLLALGFCVYAYRTAFYVGAHNGRTEGYEPPDDVCPPPVRARLGQLRDDMRCAPKEEVAIRSLEGWRLVGDYYEIRRGAPLHIAFHGYRSASLADNGGAYRMASAAGHNLLAVDQRAHGRSEGHTITFGVREADDLLCWVEYARERFGADVPIFLSGISMGAATVLIAAGEPLPPNVIGILADCSYTSPRAILRSVVRGMHLPVGPAYAALRLSARLFGGFDPEERAPLTAVRRARVPIFFAHGEADAFVPYAMVHELHEACTSEKVLFTVPGAAHGMSYLGDTEGYEAAVRAFEERCLSAYAERRAAT